MSTLTSVGERRYLTLPYSEVCMHMRIAGKTMVGEQVGAYGMVQLYDGERQFSAPITAGEAGWGRVGSDHTVTVWIGSQWFAAATFVVPASELEPGDVIAGTPGGPAFTVRAVDGAGPVVIVDFEDGTASPPIVDGLVTVLRRAA